MSQETKSMIYELDPEGHKHVVVLDLRKNERKEGNFASRAPSWVQSLDGNDKLKDLHSLKQYMDV